MSPVRRVFVFDRFGLVVVVIFGEGGLLSLNMQHRKLLLLLEALSPERHTNKLSFQLKN